MRRWVGVGIGIGWLLLWQTLRGWSPRLTDGAQWRKADTCQWEVVSLLPHFTETVLEPGDRLLRIDYQPLCTLEHIPPGTEPERLFLYEVQRGRQVRLLFAESRCPFPLGWPSTERGYLLVRFFTLGAFLALLTTLLATLEQWRWHWPRLWTEGLSLLGLTVLMGNLWLFWENPSSKASSTLFLTGWPILGLFLTQNRLQRLILLCAPLPTLFLSGVPLWEALWAAVALLLPALGLPPLAQSIYLLSWGTWIALPHPGWIAAMALAFLPIYWKKIQQALHLLSSEVLWLRGVSLIGGLSVGILTYPRGPAQALGIGGGSLVALLGLSQLLWQYLQARQYRVRLLQERLPRLWEIVDREALWTFVRETLRAYADISETTWISVPPPSPEARPWLRRGGTPPPISCEELPWTPDAMLPLPEYGWLVLREGGRHLSPEDLNRLLPFAAGISIALRHLALFEAAHEARLAALRGQLSPHFLFNALNTLQALIGENPALAEELMARLGALLRRSLTHARQVTVPLTEELTLVQDYLEIEQQRFGKRLQVQWEVPERPPTIEVPPFALQLLAENTVKHAVSRVARPITLTIRLTEGPKGVEIQVEDDGPGIDPQQVGKGVGLSNLILRLEQLYAGEATFQAEQLNPGTRITLRFPPPPKLTARSRNPAGDPSEHGR